MTAFDRLFTDHPRAVNESYGEHMGFAFGFGLRLLGAALAAFVHGLVPALFETTASTAVLAMNDEIRARRAQMAGGRARLGESLNRGRVAGGS
jgi:hypothetical protein